MAAAVVGGSFLSSFLAVLFDRMVSREVVDFFKTRKLNQTLLRKLKTTFRFVNKLLDDAEEKQISNLHVKQWLDELKDAVYEADDLLDEIAYEANKVLASLNLSNEEADLETKLEEILDRFNELMEEKDVLGLMEVNGQRSSLHLERRTTSLVDESGVYGRDADKEAIIKLLLSNEVENENGNGLGVIPIVGMGGIGKTTLAQLVYKNVRIKEQFQVRAWVCVSEEFDVFKIIRDVLREIDPAVHTDGMTPNQLHNELEKRLMDQRFLLVLDDVWDESHDSWDILQMPLRSGAAGSRTIVTTRSESVASIVRTAPTYFLDVLSDEHCWSLFARRAFKDENFFLYPELEAIGREIVRKCKGLPLAANALGCLLRTERDAKKWEKILKSNLWDLRNSHILPALRLSYHYLPSVLKRCFAYCAIFPKDYRFDKEELVLLWKAEGLLVHHGGSLDIEDIGDDCFDGLVSRSFFQRFRVNSSSFVMHDLLNDLAKFVAGDFCFRMEGDHPFKMLEKTRHLSYAPTIYNAAKNFEQIHEAQLSRTFLPIYSRWWEDRFIDKEVIQHKLPSLKRLRVLSLSYYRNVTKLPESIGNLKHLRYLNLSRTGIRKLPEVVGRLYNLQTLILEDCKYLMELPDSIVDLKNLEYLNLSGTPINQLPECISYLSNLQTLLLRWCRKLNVLPANMGNLTKLCHLDIGGVELQQMPSGLGNLTKLQMLTDFIVGNQAFSSVKELQNLLHLEGELRIWKLQNVSNIQDALDSNLKCKKHLKELQLRWDGNSNDSLHEKDVLGALRPHTNMERLSIIGYEGTRFPDWIGDSSFSNIVSLTLRGCKYCSELPPLGQLESLKRLHIIAFEAIVAVGPAFYGYHRATKKKPFGCLEILRFEKMTQWQTWQDEDGAFPCLQELSIRECPNLRQTLSCHLPSLTMLKIEECHQLVAPFPRAPAILEMRLKDDYRNVHLQSKMHRLDVFKLDSLDSLLEGIQKMGVLSSNLEEIEVNYCDSTNCFPIEAFPMLKKLNIHRCENAISPFAYGRALENVTSLNSLDIHGCHKLVSFTRNGLALPNLTRLCLSSCLSVKSLPEHMCSILPSLLDLELFNCPKLESFPDGGLPSKLISVAVGGCDKLIANRMQWNLQELPSLSRLTIGPYKGALECFPDPDEMLLPVTVVYLNIWSLFNLRFLNTLGLQRLTSLKEMEISTCPMLSSVPAEGLPTSISSLKIWDFKNLKSVDYKGIQHLTCLRKLEIGCCPELQSITQDTLPSSLLALEIMRLPTLEMLDHRGLQHLSCLKELKISDCPRLRSLPNEGLPSSLSLLVIRRCPLLAQRCEWEGEDWPKISHISSIQVNGRLLK